MKKSILAILSLSGIAMGADVELLYGYDYNNAISDLTDSSTLTNLGTGLTSIGVTSASGDAAGSLATSSTKFGSTGNGSYNTTSNRMINIQNASGLGVSTESGFSLTLNYKDNGDDWSNIASFTVGESTYVIQTGGDTRTVHIFDTNTNNSTLSTEVGLSDPVTTNTNAWYTLVLNATSAGYTFSMYSTGDTPSLLASTTFTATTGNLTMFRQGASERNSTTIRVDNFGVYDGVLTDSMAIELVKYEQTNSTLKTSIVPEPTTATLSLLALAGLAARRRRK